jgi:integrase/recombinase XerD
MNVLELIDQYEGELSSNPSHSTYRATLPALRRFFSENERENLEVEDISAYRRYLSDDYSKATVKLYVIVFKQLLKWAVAKGLLDGNFYLQMTSYYETMDSNRSPFIRRQIEPEDIVTILDAFNDLPPAELPELRAIIYLRDRALVYLLAKSGLRVDEALSLDRFRFDEFFGNWNGRREMVLQVTGKGDKVRNIVLLPSSLRKVRDYLSARADPYQPLFVSHGNRHREDYRITRQTAWRSINRVARQNGIESFTGPHAFRHFYLDNLAQSGVDLRVLSDLAGHADIRTTDRSYLGPVRTKELVRAVKEAEGE